MLVWFIILYLFITLLVGMLSVRWVKNSGDFILAGKRLPFFMATTTIFATWFGSETVMGSSSEFINGGFLSVIEDPFGASLCLILVGLFFARPLYRMNMLTFGDFYKIHFGRKAEIIASICLIWSYFGWVAAQMVAMGIVMHVIVPALAVNQCIIIASVIVIVYTYMGGMWAISITDFFQTIFIIVGLIITVVIVADEAGGFNNVLEHTPEGFFHFTPENTFQAWTEYIAAWITLGLGSIPQQDVYQRVMSSKSEKVAAWSSMTAGVMYFTIALIPLFLGLAATQLINWNGDSQLLLPQLILTKTHLAVQVLFFGALLSAIMSTASGAILAPAVILSENLIRPVFKSTSDKKFLFLTRLCVILIALISLGMALVEKNIYDLVGVASEISMVSLFIPLCMGLFLKSKNEFAAILSMVLGTAAWFIAVKLETGFPPIFTGTLVSLGGFIAGMLMLPHRKSQG